MKIDPKLSKKHMLMKYIYISVDTCMKLQNSLFPSNNHLNELRFIIVTFPFLFSTIPVATVYGVYISQLIRYSRAINEHILIFHILILYYCFGLDHTWWKLIIYENKFGNIRFFLIKMMQLYIKIVNVNVFENM